MPALADVIAGSLALTLALVGLLAAGPQATAADLVVAPDGDDGWSGTLAVTNQARSDGPFKTLARAQQAVRALKAAAPGREGALVVELRGGVYPLSAPWILAPEDGGSAAAPVVYRAAAGEVPVISGGVVLHGFTVDARGRWVLTIPEVANGSWNFNQLWVDGGRRLRPRTSAGYCFIAGAKPPSAAATHGYDRFRFAPGDLDPAWPDLSEVELLTFHQWSMSRLRIASIDAARSIVQCTGATCSSDDWAALKRGWRYVVENVGAEYAQPGQWHLDRASGTLIYRPLPGEDPRTSVVVAPRSEQLLQIAGDPAHGRFVDHVRFEGLTFAHTAWTLPPGGYSCGQAEMAIGGALSARGLRHSAFSGCAISHTGGWAIDLSLGCSDDQIASCLLEDLGAGGIKIGDGALHDQPEMTTQGISVSSCLIAHVGRLHPAATGVWIGQAHHNEVLHCEIHDLYYSAISLGWTWGYGRSDAHHNTIAYNHLSLIGQGVLSDMGGIYNLGVSPGTVFHHNRIHDVVSASYGGWGLYTDEGSSGVLLQDNIVYRTSAAGFHQHYGRDNRIINNIFAYGGEAQLMRTRDEDHLSFTIERNVVLYRDAPLLGSNWNGGPARFLLNHNLYWNEHGEVVFGALPLSAWRAKGEDEDSLIADPLFSDPAHGDFTLRAGSPAASIGFAAIDAHAIGLDHALLSGRLAAELPRYERGGDQADGAASTFPPPPRAVPPAPLFDDFEDTALGAHADGAQTSEQGDIPAATIRVSDQAAAAGSRSLRFSDAPGQRNRFDPHLYYQPGFTTGTVEGSFAIRMEAGAEFVHEWRTAGEPYHSGPSLRIAHGRLSAGGSELMDIPLSSWVRIAITTALGPAAHGRWQLSVVVPGQPPRRFTELPCDAHFDRLDWYGFVADADVAAVFYLDDVGVRPLSPAESRP